MKTSQRLLVVCLGNICRSPMAEGVFREHIQKSGLRWTVDSAGTSAHHQGEPPDQRAQREMRRRGIDIRTQQSRPILAKDLDTFDVILAMDRNNLQDIQSLAKGEISRLEKIHLVLDQDEVPDPYYGGPEGFAKVYEMLDHAAAQWVKRWANQHSHGKSLE
ncbi:MAG: low molecular weight phosphotyrosine protein phosphatase [Bacteroidetes bacterium]|nr:low molecular weight phosphotyrosine protein phosphatase [Bacteroidota bacterium]MDA0903082.1 low molecular weight phosphotyrosine protein phosphatase [Bacteroidota bacterium]MDA1241708.1 low molecular weight phosphotyrosine protein phosphatase [Bacteroidota bacterium]